MTDELKNEAKQQQSPPPHVAGSLLAEHQGEILNLWVDAVARHVPGAIGHTRTELSDHLQDLLEDVVHSLSHASFNDFDDAVDVSKLGRPSAMHGRERATMTGYTVDQVVQEYLVLRRTLKHFFIQHNVADIATLEIVTIIIETACLAAVKEFSRSIEAVQQKLVGTLVHDARTPLSVASNYAELLGLAELDDTQKRAAQTISKSVKRAGSMLEDLLNTVTMEAGHGLFMRFKSCDINGALRAVCTEADQLYGERTIAARLPNEAVTGVFDLALIVRTVENLISNAIKFGDKSSAITVSLEEVDDYVSIRVHNHGNPIEDTHVESIFNFFKSSDRSRNLGGGWGLGLALTKTVVQSHGGHVLVESSLASGTVFGMMLRRHFREDGTESTVLI